jgi:hypothetical protein
MNQATYRRVKCKQCGARFTVQESVIKNGGGKYCSRACYYRSRGKPGSKKIEHSGDLFYLNADGYFISLQTRRMLHRVVWEEHHGQIPEGALIRFKDGVRRHCQIENLYLEQRTRKSGSKESSVKKRMVDRSKINIQEKLKEKEPEEASREEWLKREDGWSLPEAVKRYEAGLIKLALEANNHSVSHAARDLGIAHQTLSAILSQRHQGLLQREKPRKRRCQSIIKTLGKVKQAGQE